MSRFARDTSVSVDRTRAEIERLVSAHGATQFASGWDGPRAMIGFVLRCRTIRFVLVLPEKKAFAKTDSGKWMRTAEGQHKAWEQACRASWRALLLVIRAKLEAVAIGISTIEDEFMAWTVMPSGATVAEEMREQITDRLKTGGTQRLLLGGGA